MTQISVILATTNLREPLLETVSSVLDQSFRDFELLIADDASTDGTGLELLQRLGPDPSRAEEVWWASLRRDSGTRSIQMLRSGILIHYLHQVSSRGLGPARNRAIGLASGEFLAFAEPGDIWAPRRLDSLSALLEERAELGALLEPERRKKPKKGQARKRARISPVSFRQLLESPDLPISGSILRRCCLDCEPPFDENITVCGAYDFWLRIGSRHTIGRLHEPLQIPGPARPIEEWGPERFRVYALEKSYQGGQLDPGMRHLVAEELVRQCEQLVAAYRKRENQERANFYDRKRKRFAQEIAKLDLSDPVFARTSRRTTLTGATA